MRRRSDGASPALDVVVERVDLVVEGVDRAEERLGDGVRERGDDQRPRGPLRREVEVERRAARRRLPHGHDAFARRDEVDLLEVDRVLLGEDDRRDEDAEHVRLSSVESRSRLVVVNERREQTFDHVVVSVRGQGLLQRRAVGIEQVDPVGHAPRVLRAVG